MPEMIEQPESSSINLDSEPIYDVYPDSDDAADVAHEADVPSDDDYPEDAADVAHEADVVVVQDYVADLPQVPALLRKEGLASINIIFGIDFNRTNEWTGKHSFDCQSLHAIGCTPNPHEKAISILGKTLAPLSENNKIPCYGFGDETTQDKNVFSFHDDHSPCHGIEEVLSCYKRLVPNLQLAGRTSYAPVVDAAINIVEKSSGRYHILFIITNGQATRSFNTSDEELSPQEEQTIKSIVDARSYPLSIVLVGVGDGPWENMQKLEKEILAREFGNFQFVNFTEIMSENATPSENETVFAIAALMKTPNQYKGTIERGILGRVTGRATTISPLPPPARRPVPAVEPSNNSSSTYMVCPICLTNAKDLAFGCGHLTCTDCGARLSDCPICRQPIRNRLRVFIE